MQIQYVVPRKSKTALTHAEGKGCSVTRESLISTYCMPGTVLRTRVPKLVRRGLCPQAASLLVRQLRLRDALREMCSDSGLGDLALGQANIGSILTPSMSLWMTYFSSWCLNFLICKMALLIIPTGIWRHAKLYYPCCQNAIGSRTKKYGWGSVKSSKAGGREKDI